LHLVSAQRAPATATLKAVKDAAVAPISFHQKSLLQLQLLATSLLQETWHESRQHHYW
jgi:hypothetical protein